MSPLDLIRFFFLLSALQPAWKLGQYPPASILKAVAKKPVKDVKDETLILADQAEKAMVQVLRRGLPKSQLR